MDNVDLSTLKRMKRLNDTPRSLLDSWGSESNFTGITVRLRKPKRF